MRPGRTAEHRLSLSIRGWLLCRGQWHVVTTNTEQVTRQNARVCTVMSEDRKEGKEEGERSPVFVSDTRKGYPEFVHESLPLAAFRVGSG